jgi:CRP-like cAMP-binding protein
MRLKYGKLYEKYKILHELPMSLRTELSLFINQDLIQKVKFFQLTDPSFILAISLLLKPRLSMAGDFVIYRGEIATIMYFIKKGFVEIIASDERTIVAYLGEGSYFGEIGVLLTGKRTVSVKSKTPCIFFIIEKDEFVQTLEKYPALAKYLKAVGRQRF